ncbi:lysophospholipase L1-like esterase [Frankia sp. EI5c]|uniref:SGNH/GDSL hydrolase family protein n=1 Tax=Frankia sp. EI5c TaxID=683316 RepID=UPI0007C38A30|nr:SGNH/GDSL hydrolase family protein [Frankia sp. EI5c]OAA29665.1 lysophospholipase L1-like esterase [Frankia sp. EI5c]
MTIVDDALERADPDCLPAAAEAALLRDAPWRRLVVLGDSVAAGVREPRPGYLDLGFADRVARALARDRADFRYVNLGARGLRVAEIRDRQLRTALTHEPDLAVVVAGGNDTLSTRFDPAAVRRGLLDILGPLADRGALVVTLGLFDLARSGLMPPELADTMIGRFDELEALTAAASAEVGGLHVDTHHHPRASDPDIFASDLIHANAAGHAIASAAVVRALAGRLTT